MGRYSFADRAARKEPMGQEEALRTISEAETPAFRALLSVLWVWGPRINEALRLERRDFDVFEKQVRVRMPLSKKRKEGEFHVLRASLSTPGLEGLVEYLRDAPDGRLFRFSKRTVQRKLHRINPQTSPHWFRHTRASRLADRTEDVMALVDWFGWADPRPAMHYIQMSGKLASRLSDKVD